MTHTLRLVDPLGDNAVLSPGDFQAVGAYLRAVRERRGHTVAELAAVTRIRQVYLSAIEEANYSALPSRPFAIGYARAYAKALDLDGEAVAERFKLEMPDHSEPLRNPIGVKHEKPERRPLFFAAAALIVVAVIGWNIAQRVLTVSEEPAPPPLPTPAVAEAPPAPQGPIALGAAQPPPAEQTTPVPYVTPGLAAAQPVDPSKPAPPPPKPEVAPALPAPAVFSTRAAIYGSTASGPAVVLQARKAASLIVRGAGGEVYFARQLAMGEAYRAPVGRKLQAEVTDPGAFSVYINDQLHGALVTAQTPLDKVAADVVRSAPVAPAPVRASAPVAAPAAVAAAPVQPTIQEPAQSPAPSAAAAPVAAPAQ